MNAPPRDGARQRLVLHLPAGLAPDRLARALTAGDVAAVVLDGAAGPTAEALVATAHGAGAAALVRGTSWPAPFGADGLEVAAATGAEGAPGSSAPLANARPIDEVVRLIEARPAEAMIGILAPTRHEAMLAAEAGADYVCFDDTDNLESACALATWWQTLFEVPVVIAGGSDAPAIAQMMSSRAEFIAMVDVFGEDHNEMARVADAQAALSAVAGGL